jgi:hypothetical protein
VHRGVAAALVIALASCGVRAASRVDLEGLVAAHGELEARRELEVRIVAHPQDVSARLALAALAERTRRPAQAIEQLEAVRTIGGPLGPRWRAEDRERFARLLAARARVRLARHAPSATGDLERVRSLGAAIDDAELRAARGAAAIAQLRHVDHAMRAAGKRALAELATAPGAEPSWAGARSAADPATRGRFGVWLWHQGARRAAWEELAAWHAATTAPRDPVLAAAYLAARAWWTPVDDAPPPASDLAGPIRCRFLAPGCEVLGLARAEPLDEAAIAARLAARPVKTINADDAVGWMLLTLREALRGEAAWGPAFAARIDPAALPAAVAPRTSDSPAIAPTGVPDVLHAAIARLGAVRDAGPMLESGAERPRSPLERVATAAGLVLRSATRDDVIRALGDAVETPEGRGLLRIVSPPDGTHTARPVEAAVAAYARVRVPDGAGAAELEELAAAYRKDPAIADRLARDLVARADDGARGHAVLGAVFEALADPARARVHWQAAADGSDDREHLRGLAEAIARAADPDAALVAATTAAAAWGDPAAVWLAVARDLEGTGAHQHALEAARMAIDLAGWDLLDDALDVAIAASRSLGRTTQVEQLRARRAQIGPPPVTTRSGDPTDPAAALASDEVETMWIASRWNPRDVVLRAALRARLTADDPRRAIITSELVGLAADRDPERGRAAIAALRQAP